MTMCKSSTLVQLRHLIHVVPHHIPKRESWAKISKRWWAKSNLRECDRRAQVIFPQVAFRAKVCQSDSFCLSPSLPKKMKPRFKFCFGDQPSTGSFILQGHLQNPTKETVEKSSMHLHVWTVSRMWLPSLCTACSKGIWSLSNGQWNLQELALWHCRGNLHKYNRYNYHYIPIERFDVSRGCLRGLHFDWDTYLRSVCGASSA